MDSTRRLWRSAWLALPWAALALAATTPVKAAELRFFRDVDPIENEGNPATIAFRRNEFPFTTPIEKTDIVIVGSKVTIDAELATNGGNILIVADELVLNAPIDTRTRAYAHPPFWQDYGHWNLQVQFGAAAPQAMMPFFNWLYWYDDYNPTLHRYSYVNGSKVDYDKGRLLVPMMPPGRVMEGKLVAPPWSGIPVDAPDILSNGALPFRSGNMKIFARSIQFCPACRRTSALEERAPGGNEFDIERARYLNAAGLPGPRGYLGSTFPRCMHLVQSGVFAYDCDGHGVANRVGGLSGRSQEGGISGDIDITIVNNADYADQETVKQRQFETCIKSNCIGRDFNQEFGQSLAALSDVDNGGLSYPGKVRTPSYSSLISPTAGRGIFTTEATPADLAAYRESWTDDTLLGGKLTIRKMSPSEAVGRIAVELSSIDTNPAYNSRKTLEWMINGGDREAYTTPYARDLLTPFLMDLLRQREIQLLDMTGKLLVRSPPALSYRTDFLTGVTNGQVVGLLPREAELVGRIGMHEPEPNADPLRSYFLRAGGLLKPSEHTTFTEDDLHLGAITASLTRVRQEIDRLRIDVKDLTVIQQKNSSPFSNARRSKAR